jgi:hypothetical protein
VYVLAIGGAGAPAIHPHDDEINQKLSSGAAETFFKPGKVIGSTAFRSVQRYHIYRRPGSTVAAAPRDGRNRRALLAGTSSSASEAVRRTSVNATAQASGFSFRRSRGEFAAATIWRTSDRRGFRPGATCRDVELRRCTTPATSSSARRSASSSAAP